MKVVVVGSGGREHGLAVVLGRTAEVVVTPGNPLIPGSVATPVEELVADGSVDLVVVGPEVPLVDGLADRLRALGVRVFGPGADGAQVEGSKAYMKDLAQEAGLPTARYGAFTEVEPALAFLAELPGPWVVKTDGLAAGKGVLVTTSLAEAEADVRDKLAGTAFGDAGRRVIIEEGLDGPEVSVFAVCDGTRTVCLPAAQDVKRVGDGDVGPNTGGIGAWSPLPFLAPGFEADVAERFIEPTLATLRARGIDFRGVLYAGFMVTAEGPKLLEYNIRFGDPDSQVVLLRLTSDLVELLVAAADGDLSAVPAPTFADDAAVLVVAASEGYPVAPRTGDVIEGLDAARAVDGVTVLGAGVGLDDEGRLVTAGGRVLNVIGRGPDAAAARATAYGALAHVRWPGEHHRTDIAT
ncbi:phosphoribosylamine--glycine ligase [Aquihabitans sp. G128]|uniref:phosphoribosylamine--glycine ligase n=1 Tax=Aquihabitans sp. G128 TaxID=2849779 RepID=UPI001C222F0E|nr:phosphoribosylamine--glycine ligase [Aquihabitans sp. G128]QXC59938.1 phosphoribosylamine--glycine ligase [Aquihabitans sp. G128]